VCTPPTSHTLLATLATQSPAAAQPTVRSATRSNATKTHPIDQHQKRKAGWLEQHTASCTLLADLLCHVQTSPGLPTLAGGGPGLVIGPAWVTTVACHCGTCEVQPRHSFWLGACGWHSSPCHKSTTAYCQQATSNHLFWTCWPPARKHLCAGSSASRRRQQADPQHSAPTGTMHIAYQPPPGVCVGVGMWMAGHHLTTAHPNKPLRRLGKEVGPHLHCRQLVAKGQHKIPQLNWCSALFSTPHTRPWQRQGDKTTPRQHANSVQAYSTQAGDDGLALRPVVHKERTSLPVRILRASTWILSGREEHHHSAQPHRTSGRPACGFLRC
jgi:hypothetical protein